MKYGDGFILFLLLCSLLSSCRDEPRTSAPVLPPQVKPAERARFDGPSIFQANCASCHHPMKDGTGPDMSSVLAGRSTGWLDTFFNHRRLFKPDSSYRSRVKIYTSACPERRLSLPQLQALKEYLGKYPKAIY